ncbi:MAG: PAS domain-containing protein, partial [Pseudomonadota bacterium]
MSLPASSSSPPHLLVTPPPPERLALILETVSDSILIVDARGSVLFTNAAAQRLLGQADLLGYTFGLPLVPEQGFSDIQFLHDGV